MSEVGVGLTEWQQGWSPRLLAHTRKARHQLYALYYRFNAQRPQRVAVVVVARELVGLLWSVMQDVHGPVPLSI